MIFHISVRCLRRGIKFLRLDLIAFVEYHRLNNSFLQLYNDQRLSDAWCLKVGQWRDLVAKSVQILAVLDRIEYLLSSVLCFCFSCLKNTAFIWFWSVYVRKSEEKKQSRVISIFSFLLAFADQIRAFLSWYWEIFFDVVYN